MNSNIRDFIKAIQNANKTATSAYDTAARVTRVEGGTAWVHVEGGVEETPVEMSISCEPGDDVRVRINKGAAYIIGNNTNPPTNDKAAVQQVMNISQIARQTATKAYEYLQSLFDELSKYVAKGTSNIGILSEVMKKTGDGVEIYKNDTDNNVYVQIHDSDVDVIQKAGNRSQKIFKAGVNNNQPFISAFSNDNTNPGIYSSAIGYGAVASGYNAHAEGTGIASGAFAHAEGYNGNEASETGAHAEGGTCNAFGPFTHAEGMNSFAGNTASHAEGGNTGAYNFYSHAEGGSTKTFGGYAHAEGNASLAVAESSHSEGYNTKAYGSGSHAEGQGTTTGIGQQVTVTSQSTGNGSQTVYYASTAEITAVKINGSTVSSSNYTKKGTRITFKNPPANGDQIVIESTGYTGNGGTGAHAEGVSSIAKADASHAEGYGTTVEGACSHVEGRNAQISSSAYSAHAEGEGTKVLSGQGGHAEGRYTEANNAGAHAEGDYTKAYGIAAHAEGYRTEANEAYSHAGGMNTVAGQYAQTVIGRYNDNQTDTLFEVGNGSSDARSNAFEVTYSGYIRTGKGYEKIAFGKNGNGEYGYWIPATQSAPETFVPWITSPGPNYSAGTNIDITNNVISAPDVAPLVSGKVPEQYLPSYVDDVIEGYYNPIDGKFYEESTYQTEIAGERGKIYISLDTDKSYRWSGTVFVELTSGGVVYSAGSGIDISATNEISADNTIARMTDLSGYLPLAGGTMTGGIDSKNIAPSTDDTYRLGSSTSKYNSAYIKRIYNLASIESTTDGSKRLLVPAKSGTIAVNEDLPNVVGNLISVTPTLTSGTLIANITISGVSKNLYAPSGGSTYTAGDGIDISNDEISVDNTIARLTDIPDELADLEDDSTHRLVTDTEKSTWNGKSDFSGSYNDLTDKPTIPAAQVNSDWNASSGIARILNKPTLATVATSGSYNDLSNKPTIPSVGNGTLTIQKNGTNVQTFTANQSGNATANIVVPFDYDDNTIDDDSSDEGFKGAPHYGTFGEDSSVGQLVGSDGVYMFLPYGENSNNYGFALACNDDGNELYLGALNGTAGSSINWSRIYHDSYHPLAGKADFIKFPRNAVNYDTAMRSRAKETVAFDELNSATGRPSYISTFTNPWFNLITMHSADTNYGSQLAIPMTGFTAPAWRYFSGNNFGSWEYIPSADTLSVGNSSTPVYLEDGKLKAGSALPDISTKVSKSGDTMTGSLLVNSNSGEQVVRVQSVRSGVTRDIGMVVGNSSRYEGLWSYSKSAWILYNDTDGNAFFNGSLKVTNASSNSAAIRLDPSAIDRYPYSSSSINIDGGGTGSISMTGYIKLMNSGYTSANTRASYSGIINPSSTVNTYIKINSVVNSTLSKAQWALVFLSSGNTSFFALRLLRKNDGGTLQSVNAASNGTSIVTITHDPTYGIRLQNTSSTAYVYYAIFVLST